MNTTTPKPLARSNEFLDLDVMGRLVVRILWKRNTPRRWEPGDSAEVTADERVFRELEASGFFVGPGARRTWETVREAMLTSGALEREGDALVMPLFSGETAHEARGPRGGMSAAQKMREYRRRQKARGPGGDDEGGGGDNGGPGGGIPSERSGDVHSPAAAPTPTPVTTNGNGRGTVTEIVTAPNGNGGGATNGNGDRSAVAPASSSVCVSSENSSEEEHTHSGEKTSTSVQSPRAGDAREAVTVPVTESVTAGVTAPAGASTAPQAPVERRQSVDRRQPAELPALETFTGGGYRELNDLAELALTELARVGPERFRRETNRQQRLGLAKLLLTWKIELSTLRRMAAHWRTADLSSIFPWDKAGVVCGRPITIGLLLGHYSREDDEYQGNGLLAALAALTEWERVEEKRRVEAEAERQRLTPVVNPPPPKPEPRPGAVRAEDDPRLAHLRGGLWTNRTGTEGAE